MPDDAHDAIEKWFIGRGVPHFINDYDARTDIWTRAIPLLVVAYALGGLYALDLQKSWRWNAAAGAIIAVVLVATWAATNRFRHRPLLSWPSSLGTPELVAFVVGPVFPSLALQQWEDAAKSLAIGIGILVLIYLVTSYGIIPMSRWALQQAAGQLVLFANLVFRALPLLLLFMTFLFINAEVWQVGGQLHGLAYPATIAIFVLLGVAFSLLRIPALLSSLSTFSTWSEVRQLCDDTPAQHLALPSDGDPDTAPIGRRERLNIGLIAVYGQAIQITSMVVAVFTFFVVFGFLAIPVATTQGWTTLDNVHVLVELGDRPFVITEPLLRVSGFLAAFAGMYFTVVLSTDDTYRTEFAQDVAPRLRQAFAVRCAYRCVLDRR